MAHITTHDRPQPIFQITQVSKDNLHKELQHQKQLTCTGLRSSCDFYLVFALEQVAYYIRKLDYPEFKGIVCQNSTFSELLLAIKFFYSVQLKFPQL